MNFVTAHGARRLPLFLAAALVLGAAAGPLAAAQLVPHRAIYTIKLGTVRSGSDFVGARGAMTTVLERTCEGWIIGQTLDMEMDTAEGRTFSQDLRYAGWESLDGTSYRFTVRNRSNGKREDFRGSARKAPGKPGKAVYTSPKDKTILLPEATRFPVAHTAWLVARAEAGFRQAPSFLFDGTDGKGAQEVSAFIGPKTEPAKRGENASSPLLARPGWNIRMAFYAEKSSASVPEYEIEVLQLDNGVAPRLVLDYEDFSLVLNQEKIEPLKPPDC